ncbi:MAG TPA: queuosine salvage family protein [Solirubrobacteraceae bacterium]|nr:queuosine salvage family protein [Solirubrobacteraceae bacterium]
MGLTDEVRRHAAEVTAGARFVAIDSEALEALDPGPAPGPDPDAHLLDAAPEDVARHLLALDSVNFGSGWFPTLRKRPGLSGYRTVASALAERFRVEGPWSGAQLRALDAAAVADTLGQDAGHELMSLYARALNDLGAWLGDRDALDAVAAAGGSAERLAAQLADGMPFFADRGFYKRAQIVPHDLQLAGVATFADVDRLTIFADNLVPHVLRVDGALRYEPGLAAHIDAGERLEAGSREEVEIRAAAVHACERAARRLGVAPRELDAALWNRGQAPRYKAIPRHRARSVFY